MLAGFRAGGVLPRFQCREPRRVLWLVLAVLLGGLSVTTLSSNAPHFAYHTQLVAIGLVSSVASLLAFRRPTRWVEHVAMLGLLVWTVFRPVAYLSIGVTPGRVGVGLIWVCVYVLARMVYRLTMPGRDARL